MLQPPASANAGPLWSSFERGGTVDCSEFVRDDVEKSSSLDDSIVPLCRFDQLDLNASLLRPPKRPTRPRWLDVLVLGGSGQCICN